MNEINDAPYYRTWADTSADQGVVLLVHGMGEHCERYTELAAYLNNAGYIVCSMDLPGHGQSPGKRGHINRFSDFAAAVSMLHERIKNEYPNLPVHLLGHSMGGLISAHFLLQHQSLFKSALLSGAAIESPQTPPALQIAIMGFLSRIFPTLPVMQLDASGISKDPEVVATYMADPLVNKGKLSCRMLAELVATMEDLKQNAAKITLPILIMHGSGDVMTAPHGSQMLFDEVRSEDKDLKIYQGLLHEIFNEPEREMVFADVLSWLQAHN